MERKIFRLYISLKYIKPKIWRRMLVPSDILLSDLHLIIQKVMGWENVHLHHFMKDGKYYSLRMVDDFFWDDTKNVDYKGISLADLLEKDQEQMVYEYDFGDSWLHDIVLEKILPDNPEQKYAICLDGQRNCPPEDCGGAGGYEELLNVIKNPKHREYKEMLEWLGGSFDPEEFDRDVMNKILSDPSGRFPESCEDEPFDMANYEGYSEYEIDQFIEQPFSEESPLRWNTLTPEEYNQIPLLRQVKKLLQLLLEAQGKEKEYEKGKGKGIGKGKGGIKLTQLGNLPTLMVREIYNEGITDEIIGYFKPKMLKEHEVRSVMLTHSLAFIGKLCSKQKNVLKITPKGKKLIQDDRALLHVLLETFMLDLNWPALDRYPGYTAHFGSAFSLMLLDKYGHEEHAVTFYSEKYFRAFSFMIEDFENPYDKEKDPHQCYSHRTFSVFMKHFGLVTLQRKAYPEPEIISRTPLFERLITVKPPNSQASNP